ncbi:YfjL-like protein [Clostridium fungisolvens]|uniref:YfjL-like N-terminal domain-containing protein n=1 Tax=Clostridium fungisolvens TaxID=1604897 RepID=A0A6V8SEZ6_9CLOT|nr:hypothetical protein [Clostridium fungisolvens]GFP75371.1 hypothetical protein bsdtw1_01448 [Clostridium fungisolvens]
MKTKYMGKISLFLFLFGFIGLVISAIWGNPVGKTMATMNINNFVKENTNGMELKLGNLHYNLENSGYDVSMLDKNTGTMYLATVDELGVKYQDMLPNYVYPKRIIRYPSSVFFISVGIIGIFIGLLCYFNSTLLRMRKSRFR